MNLVVFGILKVFYASIYITGGLAGLGRCYRVVVGYLHRKIYAVAALRIDVLTSTMDLDMLYNMPPLTSIHLIMLLTEPTVLSFHLSCRGNSVTSQFAILRGFRHLQSVIRSVLECGRSMATGSIRLGS